VSLIIEPRLVGAPLQYLQNLNSEQPADILLIEFETRLNTSIIALLALIAYNFVFQDDIPKLNYLTDLDWYILLSYIFCCIPVFISIGSSKLGTENQRIIIKINKHIRKWGVLAYFVINFTIFKIL